MGNSIRIRLTVTLIGLAIGLLVLDQLFAIIIERLIPATANNNGWLAVLAAGLALVVVAGLGIFVVGQIVRPIENLATVAQAMSDGHLAQRAEVSGRDEVGRLADSFNRMADQLQETIDGLDQQIADRTRRLEIVAAIGEYLNAILDIDELLPEIVNQVQDNFAYYHVHIYLLDDGQEKLVVAAGTGRAGAEMKAKKHSIALNEVSLVARAARSGEIVKVDNVRQADDWLPNPLLPDTYSEMAVPIILEGQVVGVLDVQQEEIAGLDDNDATLLRSLASQVAIAIRNARLFEEVQTNLARAQTLQKRYVEQAWSKEQIVRHGVNRVQFSLGESSTLDEATIAKARRSLLNGQEHTPQVVTLKGQAAKRADSTTAESTHPDEQQRSATNRAVGQNEVQKALVAPIKLHGMLIGNLQLHQDRPDRQWSESEMALIQAVGDQVAQIAENLRLVDSIQERASREQLISQISAKLRRATDMESLLEIGIGELGRVLKPDRTFIRLGSKQELIAGRPTEAGENSDSKIEQGDPANGVENG